MVFSDTAWCYENDSRLLVTIINVTLIASKLFVYVNNFTPEFYFKDTAEMKLLTQKGLEVNISLQKCQNEGVKTRIFFSVKAFLVPLLLEKVSNTHF